MVLPLPVAGACVDVRHFRTPLLVEKIQGAQSDRADCDQADRLPTSTLVEGGKLLAPLSVTVPQLTKDLGEFGAWFPINATVGGRCQCPCARATSKPA